MKSYAIPSFLVLTFAPLLAAGCAVTPASKSDPIYECPTIATYGINLTVVDGVTGKDACDAAVTITDGAYHEVLQSNPHADKGTPPATCTFIGALERPGTYHVVVDHSGSKEASLDVTVASGQCGPTPESRTVTLAAQ